MLIFPAIDIYEGKAVRLLRGDYSQMTIYSSCPTEVAEKFVSLGATCLHLVDLEGAKTGLAPNLPVIENIIKNSHLCTEVGGGIRSLEVIENYLSIGVSRVILGTAAITDRDFLAGCVKRYREKIAVGVDILNGEVMIRGWREGSGILLDDFVKRLVELGVSYIICTDISRDGAMRGANRELYADLSRRYGMNITASGGVSTIDDVRALAEMNLYGAIIGKAYYTGAIDLCEAIEAAKN